MQRFGRLEHADVVHFTVAFDMQRRCIARENPNREFAILHSREVLLRPRRLDARSPLPESPGRACRRCRTPAASVLPKHVAPGPPRATPHAAPPNALLAGVRLAEAPMPLASP